MYSEQGPLQKVAKGGIRLFTERNWSQECCHGEQHSRCCSVSKTNVSSIYISKTKDDIPKRKMPFILALETLSNKQELFFTS